MDFLQFAQAQGLEISRLKQGSIGRCPTKDHPKSDNGSYLFDGDWGWTFNWATDVEIQLWKSDKIVDHASVQRRIEASRKAYAKEKLAKQRRAAAKAKWILGQCELSTHAYMDSKGFPDMMVNVWYRKGESPLMVVPMTVRRQICGVQLIDINGNKKFLSGQRTNLAVFTFDAKGRVFLCEGYATAMSLKVSLAKLCIPFTIHACFSAGNLAKIAKHVPGGIVIADNDVSGTGQRVAQESGLQWWMSETTGQDFNDLWNEVGTFRAAQILRKQL